MKDKGFTLIELLAVIVILAIIALIAVPIIIDIIEDSKKEALKRSAENYLKAVELSIAKENLNGEFNPTSCTIESGTTKCGDKTLNVTVDGELPESGTITLSNGTILKSGETKLTYKSGTLTYDEEGKIELGKASIIKIIAETTSGVAVNVDNQLVYYVPEGASEAIVYGYKGNIDYSSWYTNLDSSQTSGSVTIQSTIEINDVTYPVTSIGSYAFSGTYGGNVNLTSVTIPESVTSIGPSAFQGCSNLSNITIPTSVTSIGGGAFLGTQWLTSQQQLNNGLVIAGTVLIDASNAIGSVVIPDGVTSIGAGAFTFSGASSITIPSSVTSIDSNAFGSNMAFGTININKPEGSIPGAPWDVFIGFTTINWLG
ncbi:MAG: leucine-rich repeat domain-containing protein [bacterium]|nr:leucine-rich repeat domain-containing protein [bacterium]